MNGRKPSLTSKEKSLQQVKIWLDSVVFMRASVDNLKALLDEKRAGVLNPVELGDETQKFKSTKSPVEQIYLEIEEMEKRLAALENRLKIIDRSFDVLDKQEQGIIALRFYKRKEWLEIETELNICKRDCQRRLNHALQALALMLFGEFYC
jgi:RinA family phage transcriptional activator